MGSGGGRTGEGVWWEDQAAWTEVLGSKACVATPGFRMPFILRICGEVMARLSSRCKMFPMTCTQPKVNFSFGVAALAAVQQVVAAGGFPTCCAVSAYWFSEFQILEYFRVQIRMPVFYLQRNE